MSGTILLENYKMLHFILQTVLHTQLKKNIFKKFYMLLYEIHTQGY